MGREIILNTNSFLVSETDDRGIITFANDEFCRLAGYNIDELIGKPHNMVRHSDMPKNAFEDLWRTIKSGKDWVGFVKNKSKSNDYYWVKATVYPFTMCDGRQGYISCRVKASKEDIEKSEALYRTLR